MISKNQSVYVLTKLLIIFACALSFFFLLTAQTQAAQILTSKLTTMAGEVINTDQYMIVNTEKVFVMNASMGDSGSTSLAAMDFEWLDTTGNLQKCNVGGQVSAQGVVVGPGFVSTGDGWGGACAKNIVDASEINAQVTFTPNKIGTYKIQVKATDSNGVVVTSLPVNLVVLAEGSSLPGVSKPLSSVSLTNAVGEIIKTEQYSTVNSQNSFGYAARALDGSNPAIVATGYKYYNTDGYPRDCTPFVDIYNLPIDFQLPNPDELNVCVVEGNGVKFTPKKVGIYNLEVIVVDFTGIALTSQKVRITSLSVGTPLPNQDRESLIAKLKELAQIVLQLQERLNKMNGVKAPIFTETVAIGYENNSIRLLQQVLASDPLIYPEGLVTGYFGLMTEAALKRFQLKWGLEAEGIFTDQTKFVLTEVLNENPFASVVAPYLSNPAVVASINQAIVNFKLQNTLEVGKVVFSKYPNFSVGAKNSDIATLQRILATDPLIYPSQVISGLYDADTSLAVKLFQERYGLAQTAQIDVATLIVLKSILVVNNASTIVPDLLLKDAVAPGVLIKLSDRKIMSIRAFRGYLETNVDVSVAYSNGKIDNFYLYPEGSVIGEKATLNDVISELAKRLNLKEADISPYLTFTSDDKPIFPKSATINVSLANDITLNFLLADGKNYDRYSIPPDFDWNELVEFNGKKIILYELKDFIVTEARLGNPVDRTIIDVVRSAVAGAFSVDVRKVPNFPITYTYDVPFDPLNP